MSAQKATVSNSAPSAGAKVNLGENAPVTREGAGSVPSDSLAAESARSGGDFGLNRDAAPGSGPSQRQQETGKVSAPGEGGSNAGSAGSLENQASYAGTAPSYVNRLYQTYEGGPKGKNLKEVRGDFEGENKDGSAAAFGSEPGSEADPSREAEARMGLERKGEGDKPSESGQRRFGVLDETSA